MCIVQAKKCIACLLKSYIDDGWLVMMMMMITVNDDNDDDGEHTHCMVVHSRKRVTHSVYETLLAVGHAILYLHTVESVCLILRDSSLMAF